MTASDTAWPKPDWENAEHGVRLYLGDCLEILPKLPVGCVDAVVTDPPYGVKLKTNYHTRGLGCLCLANDYPPVHGDDKPFDPSPWLGFPLVVLFGANYYADKLPPSGQWLIWDKRCGVVEVDQADAELAWVQGGGGTVPRIFRHLWHGMIKDSERGDRRVHPTQKPVALMTWVMYTASVPTSACVFDPYMGSGTTGVACARLGRQFIGIEIESRYFDIAVNRIDQELRQGKLFQEAKTDG